MPWAPYSARRPRKRLRRHVRKRPATPDPGPIPGLVSAAGHPARRGPAFRTADRAGGPGAFFLARPERSLQRISGQIHPRPGPAGRPHRDAHLRPFRKGGRKAGRDLLAHPAFFPGHLRRPLPGRAARRGGAHLHGGHPARLGRAERPVRGLEKTAGRPEGAAPGHGLRQPGLPLLPGTGLKRLPLRHRTPGSGVRHVHRRGPAHPGGRSSRRGLGAPHRNRGPRGQPGPLSILGLEPEQRFVDDW
jgi:hypothetical protein